MGGESTSADRATGREEARPISLRTVLPSRVIGRCRTGAQTDINHKEFL